MINTNNNFNFSQIRTPKKVSRIKVIGFSSLYPKFNTISTPPLKSGLTSVTNIESLQNSTQLKLTYDIYNSGINTPPPPKSKIINYLSVDLTTLRGPPIYGSKFPEYVSGSWFGGALASNGKLYFSPRNESYVLVINTNNNTIEPIINIPAVGSVAYENAVVGIDGKIYMIPSSSPNVLIIDPITNIPDTTTIKGLIGSTKWSGGVLAPNGKIYCAPRNSTSVLIIDPLSPISNIPSITPSTSSYTNSTRILNCPGATFLSSVNIGDNILITTSTTNYTGYIESIIDNTQINFIYALGSDILSGTITNIQKTKKADITTISGLSSTTTKWVGCILAPNGKIYFIPRNETYVLIVDPNTNTIDTTSITGLNGTDKWAGGVLAPNGKIYCSPYNSTNVLIIDPVNNTADTTTISGLSSSTIKWYGGVLGANGKIYFIPFGSKNVLIVDPTNNSVDSTTLSFSGISNINFAYGVLAPNKSIYAFTYGYNDNLAISSVLILPPTYS
jgi:hypothetical protein